MKNKKRLLIILATLIVAFLATFLIWYCVSSRPISKKDAYVTINIPAKSNKLKIVNILKEANVIRSKATGIVYILFHPDINLQAGKYKINRANTTSAIMKQIGKGDTGFKVETVTITFVEGKRFYDYVSLISEKLDINYDDIMAKVNNREYLQSLIDKYWFIDESIYDEDLFYPLEGYLYPDTYEFYKNSTIEEIIDTMLGLMSKKLELYKENIEKSEYTVHELLTIASIIEGEGARDNDRRGVAQVLYSRLELNIALGCDATTYYGVQKDFTDELTADDLAAVNAFNTRNVNFGGLPAGPICSPSLSSIDAAINPSNTNYLYFVSDKKHRIYFYETKAEFDANKYQDMAKGD